MVNDGRPGTTKREERTRVQRRTRGNTHNKHHAICTCSCDFCANPLNRSVGSHYERATHCCAIWPAAHLWLKRAIPSWGLQLPPVTSLASIFLQYLYTSSSLAARCCPCGKLPKPCFDRYRHTSTLRTPGVSPAESPYNHGGLLCLHTH